MTTTRNIFIRPATQGDFAALRDLELAAFETLRAAGAIRGDPTATSDERLQEYLEQGLLFAAYDCDRLARGWSGGYEVRGWLHVAEMDLHPDWQRKGIGRILINTLVEEARTRGLNGATLTTDRLAVFNAPFYQSIGFRFADPHDAPPHLHATLEAEAAAGLDLTRRVAMVLSFGGARN